MKRIGATLAAITVAALSTLAVASPASAHHNEVNVNLTVDGCTLSGTSSWKLAEPGGHQVANTELVALVGGVVYHEVVGTPLDIDLPPGTTEIQWRVWGGGERDYDDPALTDLTALVTYIDGGGSPLDADAPGIAWHSQTIVDCPKPEPSPSATATKSDEPILPVTGASLGGLIAVAVALIGGGVALLVLRRRRSGAEG